MTLELKHLMADKYYKVMLKILYILGGDSHGLNYKVPPILPNMSDLRIFTGSIRPVISVAILQYFNFWKNKHVEKV